MQDQRLRGDGHCSPPGRDAVGAGGVRRRSAACGGRDLDTRDRVARLVDDAALDGSPVQVGEVDGVERLTEHRSAEVDVRHRQRGVVAGPCDRPHEDVGDSLHVDRVGAIGRGDGAAQQGRAVECLDRDAAQVGCVVTGDVSVDHRVALVDDRVQGDARTGTHDEADDVGRLLVARHERHDDPVGVRLQVHRERAIRRDGDRTKAPACAVERQRRRGADGPPGVVVHGAADDTVRDVDEVDARRRHGLGHAHALVGGRRVEGQCARVDDPSGTCRNAQGVAAVGAVRGGRVGLQQAAGDRVDVAERQRQGQRVTGLVLDRAGDRAVGRVEDVLHEGGRGRDRAEVDLAGHDVTVDEALGDQLARAGRHVEGVRTVRRRRDTVRRVITDLHTRDTRVGRLVTDRAADRREVAVHERDLDCRGADDDDLLRHRSRVRVDLWHGHRVGARDDVVVAVRAGGIQVVGPVGIADRDRAVAAQRVRRRRIVLQGHLQVAQPDVGQHGAGQTARADPDHLLRRGVVAGKNRVHTDVADALRHQEVEAAPTVRGRLVLPAGVAPPLVVGSDVHTDGAGQRAQVGADCPAQVDPWHEHEVDPGGDRARRDRHRVAIGGAAGRPRSAETSHSRVGVDRCTSGHHRDRVRPGSGVSKAVRRIAGVVVKGADRGRRATAVVDRDVQVDQHARAGATLLKDVPADRAHADEREVAADRLASRQPVHDVLSGDRIAEAGLEVLDPDGHRVTNRNRQRVRTGAPDDREGPGIGVGVARVVSGEGDMHVGGQ